MQRMYVVVAEGVGISDVLGVFKYSDHAYEFKEAVKYDDDGYHDINVILVGYNIGPEDCPIQGDDRAYVYP